MRLIDLTTTAYESLRRNVSRSLLTVLGIVIGIAAVILMLSLGQGAQAYVLNQVSALGSDVMFVEAGSGSNEGGPPSPFTDQSLRLEDAAALVAQGPFEYASSVVITSTAVSVGENSAFTEIAGVDELQLEVFPATVASGRFVEAEDVASHARVAVLGSEIAADLFGDQDPIGQRMLVKRLAVRVVGVLDPQGSKFFQNLDKRVYIPVTTGQRELLGVDYVHYIAAKATGDIEQAKDDARAILRDAHNIDNPEQDLSKDDFHVSSQADAVAIIGAVGFALTALLSSIAAISLLVGGIGIMNMMLVSVTERTREIGLRKAIGATQSEVLQQFLLEAVMLTLLGGVLGIALGIGGSFAASVVIRQFVPVWQFIVPPSGVAVSAAVATITGIAFGYYPARRAARLDAIEALRYE